MRRLGQHRIERLEERRIGRTRHLQHDCGEEAPPDLERCSTSALRVFADLHSRRTIHHALTRIQFSYPNCRDEAMPCDMVFLWRGESSTSFFARRIRSVQITACDSSLLASLVSIRMRIDLRLRRALSDGAKIASIRTGHSQRLRPGSPSRWRLRKQTARSPAPFEAIIGVSLCSIPAVRPAEQGEDQEQQNDEADEAESATAIIFAAIAVIAATAEQ